MFTSRAEHRLLLRIDNADLRLTPQGRDVGLVDDPRWAAFEARRSRLARNDAAIRKTTVSVGGVRLPAERAIRQPEVDLAFLRAGGQLQLEVVDPLLDLASLETTYKYEGYLKRQHQAVDRLRRQESKAIPRDFTFDGIPGLSREAVERLSAVRPETIGQALRIPGVTAAAVALVAAHVSRQLR